MAAVSRLVRWLPKAVEATADDIARFGPQAGRVRSLLNFLPTMSDEAAGVTRSARMATSDTVRSAMARLQPILKNVDRDSARHAAWEDAEWAVRFPSVNAARDAARNASVVEVFSDVLDPQTYQALTTPLATGRAVDLLRVRPRYQGTPFLDVVQQLAERGAITNPRDVLRAGRIAQQDKDVMETALSLMLDPNNTIPLDRILNTARALAS